jgi:hypothetical protein
MHYVLKWQPFHLDALGLVTIIGADQVDAAVGRLVTSRYTEYLPLLGAFVLASNQFTNVTVSGVQLYHPRLGIKTTELAGWFQRWYLAQTFNRSSSVIKWTVQDKSETLWHSRLNTLLAASIGLVANGALVALTALQGDWWGLANSISMIVSIFVRVYLVKQNRDALDAMADKYADLHIQGGDYFFLSPSDGQLVTMLASWDLVADCFMRKPFPLHRGFYKITQAIGWIGFTAHVITIGMSSLATQIVTIFLIITSTLLTVFQFGCDDSLIGSRLKANISRIEQLSEKRQDTYIQLRLSDREESNMVEWGLMPHKDNKGWWDQYDRKKERLQGLWRDAVAGRQD